MLAAMRVQVFQHVPFEGPAAIEPWLRSRGAALAVTSLFAGEPLPAVDAFDALAVMGGPMSVNDEDRFPWLVGEKRLIARAVERGKTVLGVCLGAQLLASAAGATVRRNREREIGWHPVRPAPGSAGHPLAEPFADGPEVFHWHGETFDLPRGSRHLLRSEACEHQAFSLGPGALGLQFHLETTAESARALVADGGDDLKPGPFVQTGEAMLADPGRFRRLSGLLDAVLGRLFPSAAA